MKTYQVLIGEGCMHEDELPEDLPQKLYDWWFDLSQIVDGVRMGPKIKDLNTTDRALLGAAGEE